MTLTRAVNENLPYRLMKRRIINFKQQELSIASKKRSRFTNNLRRMYGFIYTNSFLVLLQGNENHKFLHPLGKSCEINPKHHQNQKNNMAKF